MGTFCAQAMSSHPMIRGISVTMSVSRRPMVSMRYPLRRHPKGVPAALKLAGKEIHTDVI